MDVRRHHWGEGGLGRGGGGVGCCVCVWGGVARGVCGGGGGGGGGILGVGWLWVGGGGGVGGWIFVWNNTEVGTRQYGNAYPTSLLELGKRLL